MSARKHAAATGIPNEDLLWLRSANSEAEQQQAGLLALLELEALVRDCHKPEQLQLVMSHETQKIVRCRQCFVLIESVTGSLQVAAISGVAMVDRTVPLIRAIESVARTFDDGARTKTQMLDLRSAEVSASAALVAYPFVFAVWAPLVARDGTCLGGLLMTRESPWAEGDLRIAERVADPYAYALEALRRQPVVDRRRILSLRTGAASTCILAAILAVPVSMTALAPFEIAARDPVIVTTGSDGVVESVFVEPNVQVQKGQNLIRLVDLNARNRLELAEREVIVAEAKIKKWQQMSFGDPRASHELAIAAAENRLRNAERDWAREQLGLSEIHAKKAGIVIFSDKKELIGKPVSVGEKVMEIADPERVEARIDLSVADALILKDGARTKLFLDSDPLHAREGKVVSADYQPRVRANSTLSLRAVSLLVDPGVTVPRLGTRGTAQVFGDTVPLFYYLFRRPISALRQWTGL